MLLIVTILAAPGSLFASTRVGSDEDSIAVFCDTAPFRRDAMVAHLPNFDDENLERAIRLASADNASFYGDLASLAVRHYRYIALTRTSPHSYHTLRRH